MARRKNRWTRRLDAKRLVFAGLRHLTGDSPGLRRALSFYPELADLPEDRVETVALRADRRIRLAEPRFAGALAAVALHDWDVRRSQAILQDDFVSRVFIGTVRDVDVPGHTLVPVDRATARAVTFGFGGLTNWNFARPGWPRLAVRRIAEPAIVLPPHRNYWHQMLEHLLPLIEAWRRRAWGDGPLVVVTRPERPPLIDAVVAGLRADGAAIRVETPGPFETLRLDRLLVAANLCSNAERSYALAGTVPAARAIFAAAYRDRPARGQGRRLYMTRGHAKLRRLLNEDAVTAGLAERGFTRFDATWDNHPEQIAAFSAADVVVGPHGAGLTNAIFMPPGSAVVELFPFDHRKTPTLHLCAEHDLRYRAIWGGPEGRNQAFAVDPRAVFEAVDAVLREQAD